MELDDIDAPNQVLSRTSRFAPKSKLKSKPNSQPEPRESVPKAEPREFGAAIPNKKEDAEATTAMAEAETASASVSASNGDVKMEDETLSEAKEESMEDDAMEEDAVVREIDVFFNTPMDDDTKLYVLQYPLRPSWRPYDLDDRCEEVRVKPSSDQMEVDLALDVDSKNFDQDFGNRLKLTKQTLSSSWKVPHTTGHAIGVLIGNKLHLNIIHTVVQLRPSLEHLRSGGSKRKNNVAGDGEVTVKLEESAEGRSVSPSKKQNKRIEPSTEEKTNYEEPWVPLKYHGPKSDFSARYLQRMVQQNSSPIQFTMNPHDYVDSLCPGASNNNIKPKTTSKRFMLSLPLEERIKKLLCEGPPVHRFSFLKHFALDCCDEEFLQVLQKHALLVQGLWAPKSSLLLLEDGESSLVRDYLLLLFSENSTISESDLLSNIPTNLRKKMEVFLDAFAVKRSSFKFTGWKFKEPADASFIKRYPKIVDAQKEVWNSIEKNLKKYIGGKKRGPRERNADPKPIITGTPGKTVNPTGTLMKNAIGVSSGRKTMSEETREALPKALTKVFLTHKVCSFQLICQGLRQLAISQSTLPKADARMVVAAAYGVDAPSEELHEIINQVATNIHGLFVLKSSPEHPEYDPLRKVVIDLLRGGSPDVKLKKANVFQAAKEVLKRDISINEYNKVMNDICVSKGSAWVLKSGDGNPT
ncbi:hypothetical protein I3760_02G016500 [Carya illinoinensis]|uniref:DNA-directed RNA polymerase III subunit RPC5 n=2 Tax=Carya illinoinensis TaxID=32201 RepID=A0A922FLQ4_CARIL|nr:DNA-directed RNA polymerase III subunit RPC5 isoform X2 [Carya illinoinensis]KAG2720013.1 hypothetical protein I3760_02G016500 [Carya illinoinensis]KAG2720014.1 hypothetical protein I3760_02G016500 [Carya illinoinensis]KAG2720015.1 hypothetical protein I3760_02G016500 [Carya illinoinensis]KAG6725119.1 hypothetical protein I3842_02G016100 [Carya illinoinensis]KAG6725120.1 hypothetical protein I3842_02G016100 [Carya illinoinensis]